jgi:D-sedoheptulose 7-phosphate isomerase
MNWASECLTKELESSIAVKQSLLDNSAQLRAFGQAVDLVVATYRRGGRLYIAGNGGSSSDAQHLAAEFVCKLDRERPPLPAEALPADTATMTAIGNDFGYEEVFARQLQCKANLKDAFLALTTSGNSPNIVRALERCRTIGVRSVLFSGRGGGEAARYADVSVIAPGNNSCQVQEVHIVLYHTLVRCVEQALFFGDLADCQRGISSDNPALSETLIAD